MESRDNIINRDLIAGWAAIVIVLFVAYVGEVLKSERTWSYMAVFMLFTGVPALITALLYRKNHDSHNLRYVIVIGYFFMYTFVMLTGSTPLVFSYILPMLSLLVLYRQKNLILYTGLASLVVNIIFVVMRVLNGEITLSNSKETEIQFALLILCFAASYVASKLYGSITKRNNEYMEQLDVQNKQIQRMSFQVIATIANIIDAKDEYTRGHSQRVSEYSYALAKELCMSEEAASNIRIIALLHDIGKLGVPDSVLNKPGKLTDAEYTLMKNHPVVGSEILKDIQLIAGMDIGAKYHHERYDGKGYPDGLKGEDIPYIARIIGIADAYDAMSSNRIYRKRFSDEKILEEFERCRGTQFDPVIADAFIRLLKEHRLFSISPDTTDTDIDICSTPGTDCSIEELQSSLESRSREKSVLDSLSDPKNIETAIVKKLKEHDGCMLLIDMDNLGKINEKYGYHRGDYYLNIVADTLVNNCERLIATRRYGGRFLGFVPEIDSISDAERTVIMLMNKLNTAISEHENNEKVTLSVGVSLSVVSGRDFNNLYLDADKALYHIKQQGKNGFYIYSDTNKIENKNISKQDLDNLVQIIQEEYSYTGAFKINYNEFEKIYEFVRNMGRRNAQTVQLILFTVSPNDERSFTMNSRETVMQYLENAIIETVRSVDVTTRYSSTQQLVMFINLDESAIHMVIERIMMDFYRMYDKNDVVLTYDVAKLDFDRKDE